MASKTAKPNEFRVDLSRPTGFRGWVYEIWPKLANGMAKALWFWEVRGSEHIPRDGAMMLIANHPSFLDPPSMVAMVNHYGYRDLSIMAHVGLFKIPIVSFFCRNYKAYPVNRKNPGRGPYVTLTNILKDGGMAGVFPEGSRSKTELMGEWKAGALRAAIAQKATIMPVSNITASRIWPRTKRFPRIFKKLIIQIHKPIPYEEYMKNKPEDVRPKDYQETVAENIREQINQPIREELGLKDKSTDGADNK
ncbi:MAG: lysophospholipid acyltransferase family protein [Planctomycetota bacterium]